MFKSLILFGFGFYLGQTTNPKTVEGLLRVTKNVFIEKGQQLYQEVKSISDEVTNPPPPTQQEQPKEQPKDKPKGWW
jgi:hypothetical protein